MILVWGVPRDSPIAAVSGALTRMGADVALFDQFDSPQAALTFDGTGGTLELPGRTIPLESISGVYLRPYESSRITGGDADLDRALLGWSEVTPALVLNRPSAMASNQSKPYQSALIHAQGFQVPDTLITTDAQALEQFWEKHGEIIYKSMSGVRSIVTRMTPAHRGRMANLVTCPTQFQQWIDGTDVRVHVAGGEVFASRVASQSIDYRYPQGKEDGPVIEAVDLPHEIRERCIRLSAALSLPLAGIDLRHTPDGEWFCFEVNPSPGFTYYEEATGQPIADAVARLLLA
jgi:glutathione synthase/RimK-type ligase-like ATP-grasp enzyme